jgi:hypothetical protein
VVGLQTAGVLGMGTCTSNRGWVFARAISKEPGKGSAPFVLNVKLGLKELRLLRSGSLAHKTETPT